jgi:NAD(P)-dependent dehydrogenase (short-subunit alcohol dehydrogenase family)
MTNKVALVTGASSGIGESAADELMKAGFTVYVAARRTDRMAALGERGAHVVALDLTDDASMVSVVDQILAEQGRIDVLVNNAGYGSYGAVEDVELEEARRQFEVNVFALARLSQLVLPAMRKQKGGRIINVSSIGARFYEPFGGWYHATKFAVEGLSHCMRLELAPFGVKVVLIAPAAIRSEWHTIAGDSLEATSGSTAYGKNAKRARKMMDSAYSPAMSVGADVVGKKIAKAATTKHPAPVYPVGKGARMIRSSVDFTPTRIFDATIKKAYGAN